MKLADELRRATGELHARAERTGIVGELMRGRGSRAGYVLLLRNLLPAYRSLERALEEGRGSPALGGLGRREVFRAAAIAADLVHLHGADFEHGVALLPAGAEYAQRIERIAHDEPHRLVAHAYTRYLGDLSGGQILGRLLRDTLSLDAAGLSFMHFEDIPRLARFKEQYRAAIDDAATDQSTRQAIVDEACVAFELNIRVSDAVLEAAARITRISDRG